jgi:hypothetical protein
MKRLISLILFLTMVVLFIGCAGGDKTKPYMGAKGDYANEVGNSTFVGETGRGVAFHEDIGIKMLANQPRWALPGMGHSGLTKRWSGWRGTPFSSPLARHRPSLPLCSLSTNYP